MATEPAPIRNTPSTLVAADLMTASPRTCSPFSSVLEAVMIFKDADCGAVPIVDSGEPVGILTDRDVALALADFPDLGRRSVADVMTKGVFTIAPAMPLVAVKASFEEHAVRRLLVVDASHQLLGIVSWADLRPYLADLETPGLVRQS